MGCSLSSQVCHCPSSWLHALSHPPRPHSWPWQILPQFTEHKTEMLEPVKRHHLGTPHSSRKLALEKTLTSLQVRCPHACVQGPTFRLGLLVSSNQPFSSVKVPEHIFGDGGDDNDGLSKSGVFLSSRVALLCKPQRAEPLQQLCIPLNHENPCDYIGVSQGVPHYSNKSFVPP